MKLKSAILMLLGATVLMGSVCAKSAALEDQYFATRDSYIQKFSATTSDSFTDNQNALEILEQKIKTIIGPVNIEGFSGKGEINLETLYNELGFGMLDGVVYRSKDASLVVTTSRILNRYLSDGKYTAKDLATLAEDEGFYTAALFSDVAVSLYTPIPLIKNNNTDSVYAYIGLIAQDIGPFLPDRIFVIAKRDERVFFVTALVSNPPPEIESCKKVWFETAKKNEEAAYSAYQECYGKSIRESSFYKDVSKQADEIVKRIYQ
jgi:hypothetical protein